jgi:hypothetical protein
MFVVAASSRKFYTGRAGEAWLSANKAEAFAYASKEEAARKAALFNGATLLHGETFAVEAAQ